jgi:hypothetical protein
MDSCRRGHPLDARNTRVGRDGKRRCRRCDTAGRNRRRKAERTARRGGIPAVSRKTLPGRIAAALRLEAAPFDVAADLADEIDGLNWMHLSFATRDPL